MEVETGKQGVQPGGGEGRGEGLGHQAHKSGLAFKIGGSHPKDSGKSGKV